jgi:hypothetical protein
MFSSVRSVDIGFKGVLGVDCPSFEEVLERQPRSASEFPLSVKEVSHINLQRLRDLDCEHEDCDLFFDRVSRWLDDPSVYPQVSEKEFKLKSTWFSAKEIKQMTPTKVKFFSGKPILSLRGFAVLEWAKRRRRPIFHPDVNQFITDLHLEKFSQIRKERVREQVMLGSHCYQLDIKSCYDQYPLSEDVRPFFTFRFGDEIYAQTCLGMGFRPACHIAQGGTWKLLDFAKTCSVASWIDNLRFIGENVECDLLRFLSRAQHVGFQFNEIDLYNEDGSPKPISVSDFEKLKETEGDFLGEHYNYVEKTRCNTLKTLEKADLIWKRRTKWTARDFAVAIGVFTYASSVTDIDLCQFYSSLQLYARVARICQVHSPLWDQPLVSLLPVLSESLNELEKWFDIIMKNTPVPVVSKKTSSPDLILIVDSSALGWGAISVDVKTGSILCDKGIWPPHLLQKYQSSVAAEPAGIWAAMCRFISPRTHRSVLVLTDHQPMVYAGDSGRPKAFLYNELLEKTRVNFPGVSVKYKHVKGELMPSDGLSRGHEIDDESLARAKEITKEKLDEMKIPHGYSEGHPWMT